MKLEQPARSEPQKWPVIVTFCLIWSGLVATEQVSIQILPPTIKTFTASATIIGIILGLNPLFGLIAQPIVGVLSDRIWTPVGRRAFFLITGAPVVAICLFLIPEAQFLWHIFVLVLIYQLFQDVLWGSDHPLLADLFPPSQRVIVSGLLVASAKISEYIFLKVIMPFFELQEIYRLVAGLQVVLVSGFAFFLNERPVIKKDRPKLTVARYIMDLMGNSTLRRFAALNFVQAVFLAVAVNGGFLVLFAQTSLGATQGEYGNIWSNSAFIPLFLSIPTSIAIQKWVSKQWAIITGFALGIVGCIVGWFANETHNLLWMAITYGFGTMILSITYKPFYTEYVPADIIGQIAGALNIFYAAGRFLGTITAGALIEHAFGNDYRFIFPMAVIIGIAGIIVTFTLPDLNYRRRKQERRENLP